MLLGFLGLLMVALPGGGGTGAWLSVLAALAITGGTLLSRQLTGVDIVQATGWHFLVGGVVLAVVASGVEGLPAIGWTPRFVLVLAFLRSEERRVGKECVSTCRSRWSPYH